jgi:hypothetical protein
LKKNLFIFFISFSFVAGAQTWLPVGTGISYGGYVNTLYVYDSVMYAGGVFTAPGNNVAQWNGTVWDSLGPGINNEVFAFSQYKGDIYIGGWFSRAGHVSASCLVAWNGSGFINPGINIEGGQVNALQTYDSLLYIGGNFDSVNHQYLLTTGIAKWNNTIIEPLEPSAFPNESYSFTIYNSDLCIGKSAMSSTCLEKWNNSSLNCIGNSFILPYNQVILYALDTGSGNLYAGGNFNFVGSGHADNYISQFNGTAWSNMGSGIDGIVYALATYKNFVFAGGSFDSAGGVAANNIAMWDGTSWHALGTGLNGPVFALAIFNGDLYAGGNFTSPAVGIAKLAGPLGIDNINTHTTALTVYPNPGKGLFTFQSPTLNGNLSVEVYNIMGEKVYHELLKQAQNSFQINLDVPNGIYLYRVLSNTGNLVGEGKIEIAK